MPSLLSSRWFLRSCPAAKRGCGFGGEEGFASVFTKWFYISAIRTPHVQHVQSWGGHYRTTALSEKIYQLIRLLLKIVTSVPWNTPLLMLNFLHSLMMHFLATKKFASWCVTLWDCFALWRKWLVFPLGWNSPASAMLCCQGHMSRAVKLFCLWRWTNPSVLKKCNWHHMIYKDLASQW